MLRLPHVFTQPLSKFEAFGDRNSRAMDYSLDKPSYYRLTDRLGLGSVNDTSDMEYLRTVKPGSQNNSNYSGILSPLVSHPSVYDSTENNPSQSQAEPHYPREDRKSLLFPFVLDIFLTKLNLFSGVECFTKAKSTSKDLELASTGPSTTELEPAIS
ncbi:hypothetical protein OCU04_004602 [Sclerotinia nivalis]|uniref:Uncharacterized protein n=1 Tax=Sclerotinia nivalis TaxID=352851 RepID=A0A9X0ARJ8_9HELO|nr:hypothetical protein OCU04_004602 [Sclerotinia nivalis]